MRQSPRSIERTCWTLLWRRRERPPRVLLVAQELDGAYGERFLKNLCRKTQSFQDRLGQPFAALAGERKCVHHDGTDLLLDIVAQHGASAVQAGLHGLRPEVEYLRGLLDIHSLDHA